jgi:hypothetical protein
MRRTAILLVLIVLATAALDATPAHARRRGFEHRFSILCGFSHFALDDPIVNFGVDASHLHAFFGNRSVNRVSTYTSMRTSALTTCDFPSDTAGYWVPALLARGGSAVQPVRLFAYYRTFGVFNRMRISAFPPDLRMVSDTFEWLCRDSQAYAFPPNCDTGKRGHRYVGLRITFADCWDGVNLDSPDHRSHVAVGSSRGGCPASHPIPMPRLAINVRFATKDATGLVLSSGVPSTAHGDFWNTWDQSALEQLVQRCLGATAVRFCGRLRPALPKLV